jgi:hypothetical protein
MDVQVIRVNGALEQHRLPARERNAIRKISELIGAEGLDVVNLRDGRVMLVDDTGAIDGKPANQKATEIYHAVCRPGTTWAICGDVAIARDNDFA